MSRLTPLDERSVVVLAPQVLVVEDDDGVTAFVARRGTYWRGNRSARTVFGHLREEVAVAEVVTRLCPGGVERERVRCDVIALLTQLRRADIVQVVTR
jgi:hypothetical protein